MKKVTAVLVIFIMLCCVSCTKGGSQDKRINTNIPFTCTALINYDTLSIEAKLTYRNTASATLEVLSPNSLSGLVFDYDGQNTTAKYMGLSFPLSELGSSVPSAAKLIFSSLIFASNQKDTEDVGNYFKIKGNLNSFPYELYFNKDSGYLEKFTCTSLNFEAKFKNFKYLD